jgi:hypothetical protein
MLSDTHKNLIQRAIDGELTDGEKVDFHRLLESSPEARAFYQQLDSLSMLPSQLPPQDAPAGLKPGVLRAIGHTYVAGTTTSSPRSIGAMIGSLFTPRLAYGMAAGLILGIAVSALTLRGPVGHLDPLDLSGTIVGGKSDKSLQRVDSDSFSEGQATGRIAVEAGAGLDYIQLELESTQEVSAVIEYDPDAYVLRAFEQATPQTGEIVNGQGQLRASHVGRNRYLFVLERTGESTQPVVCRIEGTGVIYQRELQL